MNDDCIPKPSVVDDKAIMMRWEPGTNYSQAWSDAGQKAKEPVHTYMEKQHSVVICTQVTTTLRMQRELKNS